LSNWGKFNGNRTGVVVFWAGQR